MEKVSDNKLIMWKSYKYLYYKLYKLFVKINGKSDITEYVAMFAVATLLLCNLFAILNAINVFYPFWDYPEISRSRFFIYLIPYTLIFYFAFVFNTKYKRILEEFKNENEEHRKKGTRNVILYIAVSFFLVIVSLSLIVMKNEGLI